MSVKKNKGTNEVRMAEQIYLPVEIWNRIKAEANAAGLSNSEFIEKKLIGDVSPIPEVKEDEVLKMDGYDECLIGVVQRFGQPPIACYSKERILGMLQYDDGMSQEDAEDFFYFKMLGAWVGDSTPCFLFHD